VAAAALRGAEFFEAQTSATSRSSVWLSRPIFSGGFCGLAALTLFKLSTLTKAKLGVAAALAVGGLATTLWLQHESQLRLLRENQLLPQQLAQQVQSQPATEVVVNSVEPATPRLVPRRALPAAAVRQADSPALGSVAVSLTGDPTAQLRMDGGPKQFIILFRRPVAVFLCIPRWFPASIAERKRASA
jgi:hypothetical protein